MKASADGGERPYEPANGMCSKCNCTSVNGTSADAENGKAFTLDCSLKNFQRLFAKYPQELGDNHTGNLVKAVIRNCIYKLISSTIRRGTGLHNVVEQLDVPAAAAANRCSCVFQL